MCGKGGCIQEDVYGGLGGEIETLINIGYIGIDGCWVDCTVFKDMILFSQS